MRSGDDGGSGSTIGVAAAASSAQTMRWTPSAMDGTTADEGQADEADEASRTRHRCELCNNCERLYTDSGCIFLHGRQAGSSRQSLLQYLHNSHPCLVRLASSGSSARVPSMADGVRSLS